MKPQSPSPPAEKGGARGKTAPGVPETMVDMLKQAADAANKEPLPPPPARTGVFGKMALAFIPVKDTAPASPAKPSPPKEDSAAKKPIAPTPPKETMFGGQPPQ